MKMFHLFFSVFSLLLLSYSVATESVFNEYDQSLSSQSYGYSSEQIETDQADKYVVDKSSESPKHESHEASPKHESHEASPKHETHEVFLRHESLEVSPEHESHEASPKHETHEVLLRHESLEVSPEHESHQVPPENGSQQVPPEHGSHKVPPENGSHQVPPEHGSHQVPPENGSHQVPPEHETPETSTVHEPTISIKKYLCLGCETNVDMNKADASHISQLADDGIEFVNRLGLSKGWPGLRIVNVTKVTKQIVNGVKYKLDVECVPVDKIDAGDSVTPLSCTLELLVQPWVKPEPQILNHNCYLDNNVMDNEILPNEYVNSMSANKIDEDKHNRNRREVKGISNDQFLRDVGADDMKFVRQMADYALETFDNLDNDDNKRILLEIEKAKKQLLVDGSGIMYYLTLRTVSTACAENDVVNQQCLSEQVSPVKTCKIHLHTSWNPKDTPLNVQVVKAECSSDEKSESIVHKRIRRNPKKHGLVGAPMQTSVDDEGVVNATAFALDLINDGSGSSKKLGVFKIVEVQRQVVAGMLYTIKIQVAQTNCAKAVSETNCTILQETASMSNADFNECDVTVWDKPWVTPRYTITKLKCIRPNTNQLE